MNKEVNFVTLIDLYGKMLSQPQYESLDLYYNEDYSLAEIGDNLGKTRQGVFDCIKRGENALLNMESKLGFLKRSNKIKDDLNVIFKLASDESKSEFKESLKKISVIAKKYSKD